MNIDTSTPLSFSEQLTRLRKRRRELLDLTHTELEELERQLEVYPELELRIQEATLPLQTELTKLKAERTNATQELITIQQKLAHNHAENQKLVAALQVLTESLQVAPASQIETQVQRVSVPRVLKIETTPPPRSIPIQTTPEPTRPAQPTPTPARQLPIAHTIPTPVVEVPVAKTPKVAAIKTSKKSAFFPLLMKRGMSLAVIVGGLFGGWQLVQVHANAQVGQVAGVSTDPTITAKTAAASTADGVYPETQADIPFESLDFEKLQDPIYGISLLYPKNVVHVNHIIGSDNIWFLRKEGYMLKITREDTLQSLDQWWKENQANLSDQYAFSTTKATFKGLPALVGTTTTGKTPATLTIVRFSTAIYQIWQKSEPADTVDAQTVLKMMSSLQFINS